MEEFVPNLRDNTVMSALKKLTIFSLLIIGLPLASMFIFKKFIFEDILHYSSADSTMYSAIFAVVLIHVILVAFIYVAYSEDDSTAKAKKQE